MFSIPRQIVRRSSAAKDDLLPPLATADVPMWVRIRHGIRPRTQWVPRSLGAAASSTLVHALLLVAVALIPLPAASKMVAEKLEAIWVEEADEVPPEELAPETELVLAEPDGEEQDSVFSAAEMSLAEIRSDEADLKTDDLPHEVPDVELAQAVDLLEGFNLDDAVVRAGSMGETVADVEGAVDRITHEIALNLEQSDVLVVWLMDASISLVEDRQAVAQRLERVYREIEQIEPVASGSFKAAVVAYGAQARQLVAPTSDGSQVVEAIRNVPVDESGQENVFSAVLTSIHQYKPLLSRQGRKMMLVVWTDESGDDDARLDEAVDVCQRLAVPVYAVGPPSMFGRREGMHPFVHPDDGQTYQIAVDRGPDSVFPELLRMPYWFEGDQYDSLVSGIGPFALTRLTVASGGAYFINDDRPERDERAFSLDVMRRYLPSYVPASEYLRDVQQSPLRLALLRAVELTWNQELKGTPRLEFAPTAENYQQQLREAQQTVAYNQAWIDQALRDFSRDSMNRAYEEERSARWRAWYDLTFGRLLAMRVRCNEYNWACATMKAKGSQFVRQESNRWEFVPGEELRFGSASRRDAKLARELLERCLEEHAETPWALLAERELSHPFGFVVEESYVAPPRPSAMQNRPVAGNPPVPPEGRRDERLRRIPKPAAPAVTLPRL
jgi:hypothetical protein